MRALSPGTLAAAATAVCLAAATPVAHAEWNTAVDASVRHDDNVANGDDRSVLGGDTLTSGAIAVSQHATLNDGLNLQTSATLDSESHAHYHGLDETTVGGSVGLRKKWGWDPYAPWLRISVSAAHESLRHSYRDAAICGAGLSVGRRFERWSMSAAYLFERHSAASQEVELPGISGDAFSQIAHNVSLATQFTYSDTVFVTTALSVRHGDVTSTERGDAADSTYTAAARAVAEDPAFGDEAYAYEFTATTYGIRGGISYAPAVHHLLGLTFAHYETHADGGVTYTKSIPELSWKYVF